MKLSKRLTSSILKSLHFALLQQILSFSSFHLFWLLCKITEAGKASVQERQTSSVKRKKSQHKIKDEIDK